MLRSLLDEFEEASKTKFDIHEGRVLMLTGMAPYSVIKQLSDRIMELYPQITIEVMPVVNDFFGHRITVTGLITGRDILKQVAEKYLNSEASSYQKKQPDKFVNNASSENAPDPDRKNPYELKDPKPAAGMHQTLIERQQILDSFTQQYPHDIAKNLPFDFIVIPSAMLRAGEKVFLDDITVDDLQNALQTDFRIVKSNGEEFFKVLCREYIPFYERNMREAAYEQTDSGNSR